MATIVDRLRAHLIGQGIVRAPDVPGPGARPWLPPVWRHPDDGPVGPGDALEQGKPGAAQDDGTVVSLMLAPGIPPAPGEEERRIDGVDIVTRGRAVSPLADLDVVIRHELVGLLPGGRVDWVMGGLYVIQSRQWRPWQPLSTEPGIFTFTVGYTFETRAT